jgi:hypothetical protein
MPQAPASAREAPEPRLDLPAESGDVTQGVAKDEDDARAAVVLRAYELNPRDIEPARLVVIGDADLVIQGGLIGAAVSSLAPERLERLGDTLVGTNRVHR